MKSQKPVGSAKLSVLIELPPPPAARLYLIMEPNQKMKSQRFLLAPRLICFSFLFLDWNNFVPNPTELMEELLLLLGPVGVRVSEKKTASSAGKLLNSSRLKIGVKKEKKTRRHPVLFL